MKTPTIEALDAAFSAHNEPFNRKDRVEQMTWFLDAIDESKLLYRELFKTLERMTRYIDAETDQLCLAPEDVGQWIMLIASKFFFIGWNTRGAIEDDEKLRNLR